MKSTLAFICTLLLLGACDAKPESAVANPSAASETNAAEPAQTAADDKEPMPDKNDVPSEKQVQILISSDKKIEILVEDGKFTETAHKQYAHPTGITRQQTILLQHDPSSDITLYAATSGEASADAKTYFSDLTQNLNNQSDLENIRTGIATENRMNYQFSQTKQNQTLNVSCIAIYESHLYTVCASSTSAPEAQLAQVLQDVNLSK